MKAASATLRTDSKRTKEGHVARDVALGGGAAFAGWLLWRLTRRGGGGAGDGTNVGAGSESLSGLAAYAAASSGAVEDAPALAPCRRARLSSAGWELDGTPMESVHEVIVACQHEGRLRVLITGGANYLRLMRARRAFADAGLAMVEERKTP